MLEKFGFLKHLLINPKLYRPGLTLSERSRRYNYVLKQLNSFDIEIHNVFGNHEFKLKEGINVELPEDHYYSWDSNGVHFIALNTNEIYRRSLGDIFMPKAIVGGDFSISHKQINWLKKDLELTHKPVVIFTHVPIDDYGFSSYDSVTNAAEARNIIKKTGNVIAVIQAHSHHLMGRKLYGYIRSIGNIPYIYTPAFGSSITGPFYSILDIDKGILSLTTINLISKERKAILKKAHNFAFSANLKIAIVNDIHFGPKRWDLYGEGAIKEFLGLLRTQLELEAVNSLVNNGDWIDGHM